MGESGEMSHITNHILLLENAGSGMSGAKTGILLCRFAVGRVNDVAETGIVGNLEEGMLFLAFEAHVEADGEELFLGEVETQLLEHRGGTSAVAFDVVHAVTVAEVVKQGSDGQAVVVEQGYIRIQTLVVGFFFHGQLVGLPSVVGQSSFVAVMTMTTAVEEAVVFHVINHFFNVLAVGLAQSVDDVFFYTHVKLLSGVLLICNR